MNQPSYAAEIVYNYQESPPYRIHGDTDLSREFVKLLEKYSDGAFQGEVQFISRDKLNKHIRDGKSTIAIWVNPLWFAREREDLIYTSPIIWDKDDIISFDKDIITHINTQDSYQGLTIAGHTGYFYKDIDSLVEKNILKRKDYNSVQEIMKAVSNREADIGIANLSVINYFISKDPNKYIFHHKKWAQDAYFHYMLLTPDKRHFLPTIESAIQKIKKSEEWHSIVKRYGMVDHVKLWDLDIEELLEVEAGD